MANQVEKAEAELWEGRSLDQGQRNHWLSGADSMAQLYFQKAEEMVKATVVKPQLKSGPLLYNQRMRLALLAGRRKQAVSIYNEMKKAGVAPSAVTFSIMFDGLSNMARYVKFDAKDQSPWAEQVDRLALDLKRLHHDASLYWPSSSHTRAGARGRNRTPEATITKLANETLAQGSNTAYQKSHLAMVQLLVSNTTALCRAYAAYLQLLSRTSTGRPERVWSAYESLRNGDGRPEKMAVRDFARPFRSKAIFTTMLWFVIQQVSDPEARRATARAILTAQKRTRTEEDGPEDATPEPIAEDGSGWQPQGSNLRDDRDILSDASLPSTPYGQAKQLWLDWESTIQEANLYKIWPMKDNPMELLVDEQAYRLFTSFFSKCRTPEQQAFVKQIENSPATQEIRKSKVWM